MNLTNKQKQLLLKHDWDVVETEPDADGKTQNCSWISINAEDGVIFQECLDSFGLTGDKEDVKLLVIGTKEGE